MANIGKEFVQFDYQEHGRQLGTFVRELRNQQLISPSEPTVRIQLDWLALRNPELYNFFTQNVPTYLQLLQDAIAEPGTLPERVRRKQEVKLIAPSSQGLTRFRDVQPQRIGQLLKVRATATFVSPNIPECQVAAYYCENCRETTYVLVRSDSFRPPQLCQSERCLGTKQPLQFAAHMSCFSQLRVMVVQEMPDEIPAGATPRVIQCVYKTLPTENPECPVRPGDRLELTGFLMPMASMRSIFQIDQSFVIQNCTLLGQQTEVIPAMIRMDSMPGEALINLLIRSFAPSIYGNEMPKLACLCSLVGGCSAAVSDIAIRQNINLLLVGDPGVAKSQLLKYVTLVSPRGMYISGRGASGAGLTASVVKIPQTSEFSLEPGALILSDQGVCCIDEFDKLLDEDRTAIYEVLEQQTISVSKAGINASLHARTTVCAAANPKYSKWDEQKTLKENVDLPEALISRFDVLYVMRDFVDEDRDRDLARFVAKAHCTQGEEAKPAQEAASPAVLSAQQLKGYLDECSHLAPQIRPELVDRYVECYVADRAEKEIVTPRALLATVRLSQAIAKLRRSQRVDQFDIDTARQLIRASEESAQISGLKRAGEKGKHGWGEKASAAQVIRTLLQQKKQAHLDEITRVCAERGISADNVNRALSRMQTIDAVHELDGNRWELV